MFLGDVPVCKKNEILDEGRDSLYFQVFPWHLYFMREHSLVELTEYDNSAADIMVHSIREVPSIGFPTGVMASL